MSAAGRRLHKPLIPAWIQAVLLLVVGLTGMLFYMVNVEQTSPVASVEIKLSRKEVTRKARTFAAQHQFDTSRCLESTVFSCDQSAKTFLEYKIGLRKANDLMRNEVPVWYWATRFCKPLTHEEFQTRFAPDGHLMEFNHVIQNERSMPSISHDEAKTKASQFVEQCAQFSLKEFRLFEDQVVPRAHRVDHTFIWLDSKRINNDAGMFITVDVAGDEIVRFSRSLGMPETWDNEYRSLRSYNEALQDVANIAHWILFVSAFGVVLVGASRHELNLKFALTIAVALASCDLLNAFNELPDELAQLDKAQPMLDFWIDFAGKALSSSFWEFLEGLLLGGAGELLYRKAYPEKIALPAVLLPQALQSSRMQKELLLGYTFAGLWLGWNTFYYLVGTRCFNFFSPLDWPLESVLSSSYELINAFHVGFSATVGEEFMYRAVGLLLLQKLVKNFWIANFIQAAAWSFGHSNYPQEPAFVRGLELLVPGLVCGWTVRRFGLMPSLIAHYLYDAFLGVFPLLQSPVPSIRWPAIAPLIPCALIPPLASMLPSKPHRDLSNAAVEVVRAPAHQERAKVIDRSTLAQPLSAFERAALFGLCIVALFVCLSARFFIVAQHATVTVSRERAETLARNYLVAHKIEPAQPLMSTGMSNLLSTEELQYVMESASLDQAIKFAEVAQVPLTWAVRFMQPGDSNEQLIYVRSESQMPLPALTFSNGYQDRSPSEEEARRIAESYLRSDVPAYTPYRFRACSTRRYGERTDHDVTFVVPRLRVADADFVVKVELSGSKIARVNGSLDIPDDWHLRKSKLHSNPQLTALCKGFIGIIFAAAFFAWVIGVYRASGVHWRAGLMVTLFICVLMAANEYNKFPVLLWNYPTNQALLPYLFSNTFEGGSSAVFFVAGVFVLSSAAIAAGRLLLPGVSFAQWLCAPFVERNLKKKADMWIDGVLSGLACILFLNACFTLTDVILLPLSQTIQSSSLDSFCAVANTFSPVAVGLCEMLRGGTLITFAAPVLAGLYMRYGRTPLRFWLVAVPGCLIYCAGSSGLYQFLFSFSCCFAMMMVGWTFARRFIRLNPLGYFIAGGFGHILNLIRSLVLHGPDVYRFDIAVLSIILAAPLAYALALLWRSRFGGQSYGA